MHSRLFCLVVAVMCSAVGRVSAQSNFVYAETVTVSNVPGVGCVLATDVNGDGKPDLVCVDGSTNTLTVFTNNGAGAFLFAQNVSVDSQPAWVAAADVYGNGRMDLISSSAAQHTLTVTTNTGSGSISNANYSLPGQPYHFAAGDLNGDGKPDLVAVDYTGDGHSSGTLTVLTNNGSGAFALSWNSGTVVPYAHSVAVADFNHDGKLDLAAGEYYASPQVLLFTNAGNGQFVNAPGLGVSGNDIFAAAADFDGDGWPDLAVADSSGGVGITVYTNNHAGNFVLQAGYSVGSPGFLLATDVNGDGKPDLVATLPANNSIVVLTNDGVGNLSVETTLPAAASPSTVSVADFNGDGAVDLAVAGSQTNALVIYFAASQASPLILSFTPASGAAGTPVTITGTNFLGATNVTFNGAAAAFTVNSNSQITATVPTNATTGPLAVYTTNGVASSSVSFVIGDPPVIQTQPTNAAVILGQPAAFSATVSGTGPMFFQWQKNGVNLADAGSLAGSTSSNLTINPSTFTDSGFYRLIATNAFGNVTSAVVSLFVDLSGTNSLTFTNDASIILPATETISSSLVLDGAGHQVTISGNHANPVFTVNGGVSLTLRGITVANGYATNSGGGIVNAGGTVSADQCTFSNNIAIGSAGATGCGGAIYNSGSFGILILNNSTFVNNQAIGGNGVAGTNGTSASAPGSPGANGGLALGGGICNDNSGTVIITNCTFFHNQAVGGNGGQGGNGYNGYSYQYVCGSYCCHPGAFGCNGYCNTYCTGYVYGGPGGNGGNGGGGYGGDLYNNSGNITLINTTLAGGAASGGAGGAPGVNGSYTQSGYGVAGSPGAGAGGNAGNGVGQFYLKNSIVANPTNGGNYWGGAVIDAGNNLSSDATLVLTNFTSVTNASPNLASLADNGGPTLTLALLPASPAIRAGDTNGAPLLDQRGMPRKSLHVDAGAFETQIVTSSVPSAVTGTIAGSATMTNEQFRITFTNLPGASFSVWTTTNLSLPLSDWMWLGYPREITPGAFEFDDLNFTNNPQEFYRVTSP